MMTRSYVFVAGSEVLIPGQGPPTLPVGRIDHDAVRMAFPGRQSPVTTQGSQPMTPVPPGTPASPAAWSLAAADVARQSGTDVTRGLSQREAAARLSRVGPNEVARRRGPSLWRRILGQLTDTMILVLLGAAALTAVVGDFPDTVVILAVIAVNSTIGVSQEIRASRAIDALSTMTAPSARVVRDGAERTVAAREVVAGDLLRLVAGDVVSADARLLRSESLEVDEAALTGESVPAAKAAGVVHGADTPLADRAGMVHAGTVITRGRADAVVTGTGSRSALGTIAQLLDERRAPLTPLQRRLARLGRQLSLGAAVLCLVVAALGVLRGEPLEDMAVTAISLAVAAIPESLPAVVSLSLALGAQRMASRGALIRQLPAVETLGSVTVIASDKTGTLTEGVMSVERAWTPTCELTITGAGYAPEGTVRVSPSTAGEVPPQDVLTLLAAGALCNDARLRPPEEGADWAADGDPTEAALLAAAARAGLDLDQLRMEHPRLAEVPFDAIRARMATAHRVQSGQRARDLQGRAGGGARSHGGHGPARDARPVPCRCRYVCGRGLSGPSHRDGHSCRTRGRPSGGRPSRRRIGGPDRSHPARCPTSGRRSTLRRHRPGGHHR